MNPMMILKQYLSQGMTPQNIISKMKINNPIMNNIVNMAQKRRH